VSAIATIYLVIPGCLISKIERKFRLGAEVICEQWGPQINIMKVFCFRDHLLCLVWWSNMCFSRSCLLHFLRLFIVFSQSCLLHFLPFFNMFSRSCLLHFLRLFIVFSRSCLLHFLRLFIVFSQSCLLHFLPFFNMFFQSCLLHFLRLFIVFFTELFTAFPAIV
jgi:hypothetical protein